MADLNDVRSLALSLPETTEERDRIAFSVNYRGKRKAVAWIWMERVHPKKPRVPNPEVIAVRVRDLQEKELLLASDPAVFFTEPHYSGFPAVLVRLEAVEIDELKKLIVNAWRCQAPPALLKESK